MHELVSPIVLTISNSYRLIIIRLDRGDYFGGFGLNNIFLDVVGWGLVTCVDDATLWLRLNVARRSEILLLLRSDWS
jgi:hypothetical protein